MQAVEDTYFGRDDVVSSAPLLVDQLSDIQARLSDDEVDGWLLYDFRGSNPTASNALGLEGLMVTRRVLYYIPRQGLPVLFCHAMDLSNLPLLPGRQQVYSGWRELDNMLRKLLEQADRVAMEVFPDGAIPYLSRVDAGTRDWIASMGVDVVTSADLVQYFLCRFSDEQADAHRESAQTLDTIKDTALDLVRRRLADGYPLTEYDVQQFIMEQFSRQGVVTDHPPIVAAGAHTADPHYVPFPDGCDDIDQGDLLMIALWGRCDKPVYAYANITWMAHVGQEVSPRHREMFELVLAARDAALDLVRRRYNPATKNGLRGWEVDRAARDVIEAKGLGDCFPHRAGHNIGVYQGHGDGTHIDDLETHDTRSLIQGLCFSLEPGVYLDDFGVRSGIDVYLGPQGMEVTGPLQDKLVCL